MRTWETGSNSSNTQTRQKGGLALGQQTGVVAERAEPETDFAERTKRICCWSGWMWKGRQREDLMPPGFLSLKLGGFTRVGSPRWEG